MSEILLSVRWFLPVCVHVCVDYFCALCMVDHACPWLQVFWVLEHFGHIWPHADGCLTIVCKILFMVVRPQRYLKNQAILSKLFGLQIVPNIVRPRGDLPRQGLTHNRVTGTLRAGNDFDCLHLHLSPFQPSVIIIRGWSNSSGSSLILAAWNHCCTESCIVLQPLNINLHNEVGERASCLVRQPWLADRKGFVRNWPQLIWCSFIRRKGKRRKLLRAPRDASEPSVVCACVCSDRCVCHVKACEWIALCVQVHFFFFLGAMKGSLPKGSFTQEVCGYSVL